MKVAVIDVGANTVRLLAATGSEGSIIPVCRARVRTGLGVDVERFGRIGETRIEMTARAAAKQVRQARKLGCGRIAVLVTSPGRQASNGEELARTVAAATGASVRILGADEEARLGFLGALTATGSFDDPVAVCDVGGGSFQLAVGTRNGPAWSRSVDLGSLRLAARFLNDDPLVPTALVTARKAAANALHGLVPPLSRSAFATGGSARALGRIVGPSLGPEHLESALEVLVAVPAKKLERRFGIERHRSRTVLAGGLILREAQRRLGVPFQIVTGGVREGACLQLLASEAAASA
jgi:exopolyphosphatase/guanosine-5'-triphosphate,3'-diphosphate pyrophosphatase